MKKSITATIAALTALGTIASAIPAQARDNDRDGRSHRSEWNREHDRRSDRWDRQDRRRDDRRDRREWRDRHGQQWRYYGSNYGYGGYRGDWRTGERYPYYRDSRYYVRDYSYYDLPPPRPGYRYYRDRNGDIIMAAIVGGVIGLIIGSAH